MLVLIFMIAHRSHIVCSIVCGRSHAVLAAKPSFYFYKHRLLKYNHKCIGLLTSWPSESLPCLCRHIYCISNLHALYSHINVDVIIANFMSLNIHFNDYVTLFPLQCRFWLYNKLDWETFLRMAWTPILFSRKTANICEQYISLAMQRYKACGNECCADIYGCPWSHILCSTFLWKIPIFVAIYHYFCQHRLLKYNHKL